MSWFVQAHGREMPTDEKALDYIRKSIFSTTEKVIYGEVNGRLFGCSPRYDEFAHAVRFGAFPLRPAPQRHLARERDAAVPAAYRGISHFFRL